MRLDTCVSNCGRRKPGFRIPKERVNPENFQEGSERVLLKKTPEDERGDLANWNLAIESLTI